MPDDGDGQDPQQGDGQQQDPQRQNGGQGDGGKPDDGQGDVTDWRAEAQKWEKRAKENFKAAKDGSAAARKLADLEAEKLSAQERAESAAKAADERAASALARAASAEIRAALTGVVPDPAAVVEDLNIGRFLNDDGDVDPGALKSLREKYAALAPPSGPRAPAPNPAQGSGKAPASLAERIAGIDLAGGGRAATRESIRLKGRQLVADRSKNKG